MFKTFFVGKDLGLLGSEKTPMWILVAAICATMGLMFFILRWVDSPLPLCPNPDDAPEPTLAVTQSLPRITEKSFPAGLGSGQIRLIGTPLPTGIGNQPMQLIRQNGPYLGLVLSPAPPDAAARLGLAAGGGVVVTSVVAGSPGQKAGILPGDVLLRMDGTDLGTPEDMGAILSGKKAGDAVKVVYDRQGARKSTHLTLANVPLGVEVAVTADGPWLGLDVQDIDAVMGVQFNLPDTRGVIVTSVAPGSPALAAGLATGDVIRRVAQTRIRDVVQFQAVVAKTRSGQSLRLSLLRAGSPLEADLMVGVPPLAPQSVPMLGAASVDIEATWIGMSLAELTPGNAASMNLPSSLRGILVVDVDGPPATMSGFMTGDVILSINTRETPDLQTFMKAAQGQNSAAVVVYRGGKHMFVSVAPAGYTPQGTQLKTGLDQRFRQVALTRPGFLAALAEDKSLTAPVSTENNAQAVIILDPAKGTYSIKELSQRLPLAEFLRQNGVTALVCRNLAQVTADDLAAKGIAVSNGAAGPVGQVLSQYQKQTRAAPAGP